MSDPRSTDAPQVGAAIAVRASVELGSLSPDEVLVQAVYGRVDEVDELHRPTTVDLTLIGPGDDGLLRFEGAVPLERAGSFGYTVRVLPHHPLLPDNADLGLVAQA